LIVKVFNETAKGGTFTTILTLFYQKNTDLLVF